MRNINNSEQNVIELVLTEPTKERTFDGAKFDDLTDVNVLIAFMRFYVKLGFSGESLQFKLPNLKLTYLANDTVIIVDVGDDPSYTVECEQWGTATQSD